MRKSSHIVLLQPKQLKWMLKQSTLFVSPLSAQQCFKPPPSLFLIFMITKITTRMISWESEQLWATLQEWHCSSVCKFLRDKLYVTVCTTIRLSNISLHVLMLCATTYFSKNTYTSFVAAKTNNMISMQNTKCIS